MEQMERRRDRSQKAGSEQSHRIAYPMVRHWIGKVFLYLKKILRKNENCGIV